jgi:hypothetical protein
MSKQTNYRLSKKQVKKILEEFQWTKDQELSQKLYYNIFDVYVLENGKVLIVDTQTGTGREHDSKDELENRYNSLAQKAEQQKGNEHILAENFPYQENFIAAIPTLVDQLAERLSIPRKTLDNSLASLRNVDKAIKKIGQLECLKEDIFPSLIAYVGEVIKQRTEGHWQMRSVSLRNITVWEPLVIGKDRKEYLPFYIIYDQLYEDLPFSLEGAVTGYSGELLPHCSPEDKQMGLQGRLDKSIET